MARKWKVLKAAVEQVLWFPNEETLKAYGKTVKTPYEVVSKTMQDDGSWHLVIRKAYNNNAFLGRADELLEY